MQQIIRLIRGIWYLAWYLFAATIVLVAAAFGLVRLLLPLVGDYNRDIENFATEYAGRPIKIMSLDAEWHGFSPSLVLNNVRVLSIDGKDTLLQLSRARLDFDLLAIAETGNVQFKRFALSGANLSLVRQADGQISLSGFESSKIEAGVGDENSQIWQWLLSQGEISLHAKNLIFNDQTGKNKRYYFSNVSFVLRNQGDRHFIDGSIGFAERSQQEFDFAMDIRGDFATGNAWSASMYFNGLNLDLNRIFGTQRFQGHQFGIGKSNFTLWTTWQNGSLVGMQGDLSLEDIKAESDSSSVPLLASVLEADAVPGKSKTGSVAGIKNSVAYQKIIGRFIWDRYDEGWQFLSDNFVVAHNGKVWPSSQLAIHYYKDQQAVRRLNMRASLIRVEDIIPLAPLFVGNYKDYHSLLQQLAVKGDIENINLNWSGTDNQYQLAARLKQVEFSEVRKLPAVRGLSGQLLLKNNNGSFEFTTDHSEFYLPAVFRREIPVRRLRGNVHWENAKDSFSISSRNLELDTAHFQSKAVLDIDIPAAGKSPFVSVIASFANADVSKASLYYPVNIMGKGVLKWLDTAIVQGKVSSGGAIFYGPLQEFPFTRGQGVFDVRFDVEDAMLDYADEWPNLHSAHGNVVFKSNTMEVFVDHAKIFDSDVTNATAVIPDLTAKTIGVNIEGHVSGKVQNKINYMLTAPPLKKEFEKGLSNIRVTGDGDLELKLGLSIGKEFQAKVAGQLRLQGNDMDLVQVSDLLKDINGTLNFNETSIYGKGIIAKLLGQPVDISIATKDSRTNRNVRFNEYRAVGRFNARTLSQLKFPFLSDMVDGDARWSVKLMAPHSKDGSQIKEDLLLTVNSDLKGVAVNLPPPFKKAKPDVRKLSVTTAFKDLNNTLIRVSYGGEFEGILVNDFTRERWLSRAGLRFGGGPAVLPDAPGLHIAGNVKTVSYDIWYNLIQQLLDQYKTPSKSPVIQPGTADTDSGVLDFSIFNSLDLVAENFEIFGQSAANAKIRVINKGAWLAASIDSSKFNGDITIPNDFRSKSLVLDMRHMNIIPVEESGAPINPTSLPAISLNSRSVVYGNKNLGHVAVETAKTRDGLLLEQLIIKPGATTIRGHGSWLLKDGAETSSLELLVDSNDLGKAMRDLGYVETVADGKGTITAKLSWPAALVDPDLQHINGEVEMNFRNGRILDIEPGGAARLFGLFSLQTLPRRLTLDFSDLFSKGLGFDSITGGFKIEDGDAYTSNLQLKGPNADVALRGRIGLGAQDYDQKIRVTPHITDVAILLSIITSQPLLLLFQQLMKQDLDAATSFEYTLTGSWDNYQLNPVLKKPAAASEQADDF